MPIKDFIPSKDIALVETQLFDSPGRFKTCLVGIVLRHALVRMQFYDMPWTGCSFKTCPRRDPVLRDALVMTQFYDIHRSLRNFTTYLGSSGNRLQMVELLGHPDLQIVVNTSLQTVSSTVFRIRVSLQRLS